MSERDFDVTEWRIVEKDDVTVNRERVIGAVRRIVNKHKSYDDGYGGAISTMNTTDLINDLNTLTDLLFQATYTQAASELGTP